MVSAALSFLVGGLLLGLSSYVPTLGQEVLDASAITGGFALAALTLGWPVAASQAGRLYLTIGFRVTGLLGFVLAVAGAAVLVVLGTSGSLVPVAGGCALIGLGMGWIAAPALSLAQSSVDWGERGVASATNMFARLSGPRWRSQCSGPWSTPWSMTIRHPRCWPPGASRLVGILVIAAAMGVLELFVPKRVTPRD